MTQDEIAIANCKYWCFNLAKLPDGRLVLFDPNWKLIAVGTPEDINLAMPVTEDHKLTASYDMASRVLASVGKPDNKAAGVALLQKLGLKKSTPPLKLGV